jgi:hypothetical protein
MILDQADQAPCVAVEGLASTLVGADGKSTQDADFTAPSPKSETHISRYRLRILQVAQRIPAKRCRR